MRTKCDYFPKLHAFVCGLFLRMVRSLFCGAVKSLTHGIVHARKAEEVCIMHTGEHKTRSHFPFSFLFPDATQPKLGILIHMGSFSQARCSHDSYMHQSRN